MEKRWQFVAVMAEEAFVAAAVANFRYMGYAFAYAHRRDTGETRRFEIKTPLGLGAMVAPEPEAEFTRLSVPNGLIWYEPRPSRLRVQTKEFQATFDFDLGVPFDAAWDIPGAGHHRTRKRMGDQARGQLVWDGRELPLAGHALMDWSRGHLARETAWRWASGVGRAGDRVVAWNLRTGFDDPTQAENAVWVDGTPAPAGPAILEPGDAWRVEAGPLVLRFVPEGVHSEDLNLGVLASRYVQPWGRFEGTYEGQPLTGYGVVEDHWARW
jgi:Protein of unknown function (DUF2804)